MNCKTMDVTMMIEVLEISRSKGYELVHSEGFYPAFRIGRKILINVDKLKQWLDEQEMSKDK